MISFELTQEQELIRDTVRKFASTELREAARACDEDSCLPDDMLQRAWELGLVVGAIPEQSGGAGMDRSPVTNAIVAEELGSGDVPLAVAALAPLLFVNPILDFGTAEQQQELLPFFAGTSPHLASLALHESRFGFDATKLQTVAEPVTGGFQISGRKRFVPFGDRASHFLVLARGVGEHLQDLEAFIIPRDVKGLTVATETEKTLGMQALPSTMLEFKQVMVPAQSRLGEERGIDGIRLLNLCRMGSAALAVGISRTVLEFSISYAKDRLAFGKPIAQKQAIAFKLAEMEIEVNSMRNMVWKAASQLEQKVDASRMATLTQSYVSRKSMGIADDGIQVLGGHGFIRDYPMEMWYRNTRALSIFEGLIAL